MKASLQAQDDVRRLDDGDTAGAWTLNSEAHEDLSGSSEWHSLKGQMVDVHVNGRFHRRARVEDAMPDGSGVWLAAHGIAERELIWQGEGLTLHVSEARDIPVMNVPYGKARNASTLNGSLGDAETGKAT